MSKFTEAKLEAAIVELLQLGGCKHVSGETVSWQVNQALAQYSKADSSNFKEIEQFIVEDFTDGIIDLFHALKKEKKSFGDLGIDFGKKALYGTPMTLAIKYDFEHPEDKLLYFAREVKKVVDDKSRFTDWNELCKEIFEQAENFKKTSWR